MGYTPRETTGGGSSESREAGRGNRERRDRDGRGGGGRTSVFDIIEEEKRRQEEEKRRRERERQERERERQEQERAQRQEEHQAAGMERRGVDDEDPRTPAPTRKRGFFDRIRDAFGFDSKPDQEPQAEQVETVERYGEIHSVPEVPGYEVMAGVDEDVNPYSDYTGAVTETGGLVDPNNPQEQALAREIADYARTAQGIDVAATMASPAVGPVAGLASSAYGAYADVTNNPKMQAGIDLYEGGKVDIPGSTAAATAIGGAGFSNAVNVAKGIFGDSGISAFESAAGIDRTPSQTTGARTGNGQSDRINAGAGLQPVTPVSPGAVQPPQTMARQFDMSTWDQNTYSDYIDRFFGR